MARSGRSLSVRVLLGSIVVTFLWGQPRASSNGDTPGEWGEWSPWSACSSDCDSGVSSRSRECRRDQAQDRHSNIENASLCDGASSQIKVCFIKACPPDRPSARQAACSKYDSKVFSGRQYVWEPFIHPTAPCKLACRAKGEHFYANLADRVEDGTPCGSEIAPAACVSGACKPIGCDGVLASQALKDKCGVCNGDGTSCRTISGIFTSTELRRGLNYIISIPPGSTSINITELQTSRNLFLLQDAAGKTFLNGGNSSPISGDIEAAGTVFTYGARSPSSPKESIYSPGPTNITVILKLLLRGNNPGIMYSFNVPQEVSDRVIEQIKHHAPPVEVPSDSRRGQGHQSSTFDDSISQPASRTGTLDVQPVSLSRDNEQSEVPSHSDRDEQMLSPSSASEPSSATDDDRESEYGTNRGQFSSSTSRQQGIDDSMERIVKASMAVAATQDVAAGESRPRSIPDGNPVTRLQESSGEVDRDDSLHTRDHNHWREQHLQQSGQFNGNSQNGDHKSTQEDEYDDNDEEEDIAYDSDTNLDEVDEKIKEILDDHKVQFTEDSEYSFEDYAVEEPNQSVSIPLSSIVDPNEIDDWDPDHENDENEDNFYDSSEVAIGTGSEEPESQQEDEEDDEETEADFDDDDDQGLKQSGHTRDISPRSSTTRAVDKVQDTNTATADPSRPYRDHAYRDSADNRGSVAQTSRSRYPYAIPMDSQYQIPRYSQSFTFAERYKDIYSSPARRHPRRRRPRTHHHQQRQHHSRDSVLISSAEQSVDDRNRGRDATDEHRSRSHSHHSSHDRNLSTDDHEGRGESISEFGSSSSDRGSQHSGQRGRQQNDRNQASQERRLRDRQTLLEERRRRIEEQRRRYEEQLREYKERLRQRQAEIEAARSRSSSSVDTQITDSRAREPTRHHRGHRRHDSNPSYQTPQPSVVPDRIRQSVVHPDTHPQSPANVYTDRDNSRTDRVPYRQPEGLSPTDSDSSGQSYDESDYERRRIIHSRTDTGRSSSGQSSRQQPEQRRGRVSYSGGQDNDQVVKTYDTGREGPGRSSDRDTGPQIIPRVQPSQQSNPQIIPRVQPSQQTNPPIIPRVQPSQQTNPPIIPRVQSPQQINPPIIPRVQPPPRQEFSSPAEDRDDLTVRTSSSGGGDSVTPQIIPRVQPPPRQEFSYPTEDRDETDYPQIVPRVQPSGPRYVPGSPSRPSSVSALSGNDVPLGQSTDQISTNNYIPANRIPEEDLPVNLPDVLPNQIPLNTLTTDQVARNAAYEWRISGLTECTHSCGGGVQQTVIVCVDTLTQAVVTDENCRQLRRPEKLGVPCNKRPCPAEWTPGPWSPCTVTCGRGEQTRTVTCQARVSPTLNLTLSSDKCEGQERVANRQACNNNPCSSWRLGNWSECSAPCGDGQMTRDVQCVDLGNNVVSEDSCVELRPESEKNCNLGECGKGWFFTEWPEECPAECGTGEMTRQIFCSDESGSALPDNRCDMNQRPATARSCRASRPCGGLWFTGQWSNCDSKCGAGERKRDVLCIKPLAGGVYAIVGEENCDSEVKPEGRESCLAPVCTSEWYMTSWTECSQSCGTGYRTREVKCLDPDQKPSDHCPLHKRPKTRDTCNTQGCAEAETETEDPSCTDKFAQCRVVKRARLCRYNYYKKMCCKSCNGET